MRKAKVSENLLDQLSYYLQNPEARTAAATKALAEWKTLREIRASELQTKEED